MRPLQDIDLLVFFTLSIGSGVNGAGELPSFTANNAHLVSNDPSQILKIGASQTATSDHAGTMRNMMRLGNYRKITEITYQQTLQKFENSSSELFVKADLKYP